MATERDSEPPDDAPVEAPPPSRDAPKVSAEPSRPPASPATKRPPAVDDGAHESDEQAPAPDPDPNRERESTATSTPSYLWVGGAVVVAAVAALVVGANGGDDVPTGAAPSASATGSAASSALRGPTATLGCPVFAVGPDDVADRGPIGAAAGSVACETLVAFTGRGLEAHRGPAALLELDATASDGVLPFAADRRAATVAAATANTTGWIDGTVTIEREAFTVEARVMRGASSGLDPSPLGPPGRATHPSLQVATSDAVAAAAEAAGLKTVASLSPALSSLFWSCPDGACVRDATRLGFTVATAAEPLEPCRAMITARPAAAASVMGNYCRPALRAAGEDVPTLETLLAAVPEPMRTARRAMAGDGDITADALAAQAEAAPDPGAKTVIRTAEASVRARDGDDQALARADAIIREAPFQCLARVVASYASPAREEAARARSGATWCPEAESFWRGLHGQEDVEDDAVVTAARVAYRLGGRRPGDAVAFSNALLGAWGRSQAAETAFTDLAARWSRAATTEPLLGAYLEARLAQRAGKLEAAESALSEAILTPARFGHAAGSAASLTALMMGFELTGGGAAFSERFIETYITADPPALTADAPMVPMLRLCTYAKEEKGLACIERLRTLAAQGLLAPRGGFPESFAAGSEFFVRGDMTNAVASWRADLLDPALRPHLRAEAFDAEDDAELGNAVDRGRRDIDGALISAAQIRLARRAAARGDDATAATLAKAVLAAFADADFELAAADALTKLAAD
ncbi:MAG: hypothetical protein AAF715_01820 [Myxococcota bacterium]